MLFRSPKKSKRRGAPPPITGGADNNSNEDLDVQPDKDLSDPDEPRTLPDSSDPVPEPRPRPRRSVRIRKLKQHPDNVYENRPPSEITRDIERNRTWQQLCNATARRSSTTCTTGVRDEGEREFGLGTQSDDERIDSVSHRST